jgi:hypothetical protein
MVLIATAIGTFCPDRFISGIFIVVGSGFRSDFDPHSLNRQPNHFSEKLVPAVSPPSVSIN